MKKLIAGGLAAAALVTTAAIAPQPAEACWKYNPFCQKSSPTRFTDGNSVSRRAASLRLTNKCYLPIRFMYYVTELPYKNSTTRRQVLPKDVGYWHYFTLGPNQTRTMKFGNRTSWAYHYVAESLDGTQRWRSKGRSAATPIKGFTPVSKVVGYGHASLNLTCY